MEIWKDIPGYEGLYQVSNYGRVKSIDRNVNHPKGGTRKIKGNIISQHLVGHGYYHIVLSKGGKVTGHLVHRLVAMAFVPNPDNLEQVNHRDENKINNHAENLEWCDCTYNNNYGTVRERHSKACTNHPALSKPVRMIKDGKTIREFESMQEAARITGSKRQGIYACCVGIQKHHNGCQWEYA